MLDIEAAEIKIEAESIKNEVSKREKEKEAILAQIRAYQGRLNLVPALEQEIAALSRDRDALAQQYANLQNKKHQAQLTTSLENSKNSEIYRVIDEANLPEKPAFPNRLHIILLGLAGGLVAGFGAGFGRELLDSTLGSEAEVSAVLQLPVLATISEIPGNQPRKLLGMQKNS
jgi:uncharacterized protein involved in exopolysaccharide biosynthesis